MDSGISEQEWAPSHYWPRLGRLLPGESTLSFVWRFAEDNSRTVEHLLEDLGEGLGGQQAVEPHLAEVYLSRPALQRLATVTDLDVAALQRALPNLREPLLLPDRRAVWKVPWSPASGSLVRACPSCEALRMVTDAWLLWPDPWRVCGRHRRWTDGVEAGPLSVGLAQLPEVLAADRARRKIVRRYGPGGETVVADAFAVVGWWWRRSPQASCWLEREWLIDAGLGAVRTAPVVVYPEAVAVAKRLLAFENARAQPEAEKVLPRLEQELTVSVLEVAERIGLPAAVARQPLAEWLARHARALPAPVALPGERRRHRLVRAVIHGDDDPRAGVDERACLPWQWTDLDVPV